MEMKKHDKNRKFAKPVVSVIFFGKNNVIATSDPKPKAARPYELPINTEVH